MHTWNSRNHKPRVGKYRVMMAVALGCLLTAGCTGKPSLSLPVSAQGIPQTRSGIQTSFADVISRVAPAVVTIETQTRTRTPQQFPFTNDPFFRQFFGDRGQMQPPPQRAMALGSGVIVTPDGYILTNHHVVDGAEKIKVKLNDGRSFDAKVIGSDPPSDLALLKIGASNLPVLVVGDSNQVRVGDVVLAIGNPLNVGQTVTMGIISAKGRQTGLSNGSFEDFLQTDAPINQGNSGGALINTNGELVGINSQIVSPSGGSIGIGFAIPSNMARDVMDQLAKNGKVRRGQLGIVVQKVTSEIATSMGLNEARGVIVSQVQLGSAAERAGIKQGDVITSLNGTTVDDPNILRNEIARTAPGTTVTLDVQQNGSQRQLKATLGEFKPQQAENAEEQGSIRGSTESQSGKLGISVAPLTPDVASHLGVDKNTQGVVVSQVDPDGPAADAGIQSQDIIEQVNQQPIHSAADVKAALARSGSGPALLLVAHQGATVFVTVTPRA